MFADAKMAWLAKSQSADTRSNYARDLSQFLTFIEVPAGHLEYLVNVRPADIAGWRDQLRAEGMTNATIRRKMTALRSLYSYLQTYGYTGANPAHGGFVDAPSVARDGKTVGLSPENCRQLLDVPNAATPVGIRDRAMIAVLAYTGCRVGELTKLRVGSYKTTGGHKVLEIFGKGGKERRVPLHPEAFERLEMWLDVGGLRENLTRPMFPPQKTARGIGRDGFAATAMTRRAVQQLVERYVRRLGLDPAVTVHSMRVTAITTARDRGSDIIDLQDFAGNVVINITGVMPSRRLCVLSGPNAIRSGPESLLLSA